jgi:hypothetical protein
MSTTLKNEYISTFDEKLKIFYSIFFKTIDINDILLSELKDITKQPNLLNIPADGTTANTYNIGQFNDFIRNIVNFKIKNSDDLLSTNNNMDFIKNVKDGNNVSNFSFNNNVKDNIVSTLNVINVFVDILEAYKVCIENEQHTTSLSGYSKDIIIDQIELVSETTRIYATGNMFPPNTVANAGFIRNVGTDANAEKKNILYLSIQSFNKASYSNILTTTGCISGSSCDNNITSDIFDAASLNSDPNKIIGLILKSNTNYARQIYNKNVNDPSISNLSLNDRNKALVVILLKMLLGINIHSRKQTVYALYFYYKFIQLYSTLIINVSNVMYANVENNTINCINIYNTTKKNEYVSEIKVSTAGIGYTASQNIFIINTGGRAKLVANASGEIPINTQIEILTRNELSNNIIPTSFTLKNSSDGIITPSGSGKADVQLTAKSYPLVVDTNRHTNNENIDRLEKIIQNISTSLTNMTSEMSKYSLNNDDNSYELTTATSSDTIISLSIDKKVNIKIVNATKYYILSKYDFNYDLINDYNVYDEKNKITYNILSITDSYDTSPKSFTIEINAILDNTLLKEAKDNDENTELFKNADGTDSSAGRNIDNTTGPFLFIKKKDLTSYKNEYQYNKKNVNELNEQIGFNTNKVQRQKNLYDSQYNKNVFLTRQILIYNIVISIIVLILLLINLMKIDNQLVKTISLGCLGIIILLFVIYITSNITYIETFTDYTSILDSLTKTYYTNKKLNNNTYNINKATTLTNQINELNKKFISYFEKIIITIPSADSIDFYREIKDGISTELENKNYINNLLVFNRSQGDNDMDTVKYDIENNKLYIFTLLISSIIFIGIYNIYINYIINEKYLSLIIFISIIIFIIISAYYIINSNKRVRTVHKHKYWGPETSKNF